MPKKKKTNRRNQRRHVLDVKLASNQLRRRRTQLAVSIVLLVAVLLTTVYFAWRGGYWAVQRFVYNNDQLTIRDFNVTTDGVIELRHLKQWTGITEGENQFAVDLHEIKRNLERHSMIRSVSLKRELPDTLRMSVSEREPIALIRVRRNGEGRVMTWRTFALDAEGHLMTLNPAIVRRETEAAWQQLPWLMSTNMTDVITGPVLERPQVLAALEFIRAYRRADIRRSVEVTTINVDDPHVLRLGTTTGSEVVVLNESFDRQLARWRSVHDWLFERRHTYQWMDLSVSNNIPVHPLKFSQVSSPTPNVLN